MLSNEYLVYVKAVSLYLRYYFLNERGSPSINSLDIGGTGGVSKTPLSLESTTYLFGVYKVNKLFLTS